MNAEKILGLIGFGIILGMFIGGLIGLFWMAYYLDIMKTGVIQRNQIIEYMNKENNKGYEYEKGDEYIDQVLIPGIWWENGSMKTPPLCYGPMCPYNFTGVVNK